MDDAVIDTNTTGACWPWNLSTVPARTDSSPAASSRSRNSTTCALYGVTTRMSSCSDGARPALVAPRGADQLLDLGDDGVRLFWAVRRIAVVVDGQHPHAGLLSVESARTGQLVDGLQPIVVGQPRHRCAHIGMHAVRAVEEVAEFSGQSVSSVDQPAQCRCVDRFWMRALAHLRQLLGITKQQKILRSRCHGDGVREAVLACFFDDEQVKAAARHPSRVGEVPCGAADDAAVTIGDEPGVLLLVDLLPARVGSVFLLGDQRGIDSGGDNVAEQVLDDGVRLRDDAYAPMVFGDEPGDDGGRGERLSGPGWPVHGQVRRVEVEQRCSDRRGDVRAAGKRPAASGAGRLAQQNVDDRARR